MFTAEDFDFVKGQIKHHQGQIEHNKSEGRSRAVDRHAGLLNRFKEMMLKMEAANEAPPKQAPAATARQVGKRLGDLSDLPPEILAQLVSAQYDELEMKIVDIVDGPFDGMASIDEIFVALWRATNGAVSEREYLARKIYRMTTKELLFGVPGKKGVYSTSPVEGTDEADGQNDDLFR